MYLCIQNDKFGNSLCMWLTYQIKVLLYNLCVRNIKELIMEIKEILSRIGYVRNQANLSAREVSLRMGMSPQYVAQLESGRIVLTVEKLLKILEICNFPIERFFSPNIDDYNTDKELELLIQNLTANKKKNLIEFIKNK